MDACIQKQALRGKHAVMQGDTAERGKFNSEHTLSTYCVLGTVLDSRMHRETSQNSCPLGLSLGSAWHVNSQPRMCPQELR